MCYLIGGLARQRGRAGVTLDSVLARARVRGAAPAMDGEGLGGSSQGGRRHGKRCRSHTERHVRRVRIQLIHSFRWLFAARLYLLARPTRSVYMGCCRSDLVSLSLESRLPMSTFRLPCVWSAIVRIRQTGFMMSFQGCAPGHLQKRLEGQQGFSRELVLVSQSFPSAVLCRAWFPRISCAALASAAQHLHPMLVVATT